MRVRRTFLWSAGATLAAGLTCASVVPAQAAVPGAATAPMQVSAAATSTTASSDRLAAGSSLVAGSDLVSPSGRYRLTMRSDGSAALLDGSGGVLWKTKAAGSGARLTLRADGKLVLFTRTGAGAWYGPPTKAGAELLVLDSGQLAVVVDGAAAWWTRDGAIVQSGTAPALPSGGATAKRVAAEHPFASDSPWNTAIGSGARFESASGTMTRSFVTNGKPAVNRDQWSVAVYTATSSDPVDTLVGVRNSVSYRAYVPASTTATGGTDKHVAIIQPDGTTAYGVYKWEGISGRTATGQIVVPVDLTGPGYGTGTRAARVPSLAGLVRAQELEDGVIPHALAMAVPNTALKSGYVWPATSQDADGASSYSGKVPMGTLFAIPGDVDVDSLGLSGGALALAHALQDYGAYVVDRAGTNAIYCELSCGDTGYQELRSGWKQLEPLLRAVTNNGPSSVGGGGTPRVPAAADLG